MPFSVSRLCENQLKLGVCSWMPWLRPGTFGTFAYVCEVCIHVAAETWWLILNATYYCIKILFWEVRWHPREGLMKPCWVYLNWTEYFLAMAAFWSKPDFCCTFLFVCILARVLREGTSTKRCGCDLNIWQKLPVIHLAFISSNKW